MQERLIGYSTEHDIMLLHYSSQLIFAIHSLIMSSGFLPPVANMFVKITTNSCKHQPQLTCQDLRYAHESVSCICFNEVRTSKEHNHRGSALLLTPLLTVQFFCWIPWVCVTNIDKTLILKCAYYWNLRSKPDGSK